jgi:hypothetical protein
LHNNESVSAEHTKGSHDVAQFCRGNETVAILVENLEGLLDLFLRVGIFHFSNRRAHIYSKISQFVWRKHFSQPVCDTVPGKHGQKFTKVDVSVAIAVNFVDLFE